MGYIKDECNEFHYTSKYIGWFCHDKKNKFAMVLIELCHKIDTHNTQITLQWALLLRKRLADKIMFSSNIDFVRKFYHKNAWDDDDDGDGEDNYGNDDEWRTYIELPNMNT